LKENQRLTKEYAFTICLLPSEDSNELVEILWPRQHNNKRFTDKNSNELRVKIKSKMPGYLKSADKIIYTHNASIEEVTAAVLEILNK
jgi:DNA-directed RNA polymerase subunit F